MNLDKKLAKYARKLDNPKYYLKILKIIDKADEKRYRFKDFSDADIMHIFDVIDSYFEINLDKHEEIIEYCNRIWFIVSDKHYILAETPFLSIALSVYIRCYMFLVWSKITRLISPTHFYECNNIDSELHLFRGGIKAAEYIGCDIYNLEENRVKY